MTQGQQLNDIAARIWGAAGGRASVLDALTTAGPRQVLPAGFDVTGLAAGSVAAATLAAAEFFAARNEVQLRVVTVDSRDACAAFAAEALFTPVGWDRPEIWDPIAGNYQAQDGWIRLHTNYGYHRAAAERVLGTRDKESVTAAVATWKAADLETAVVEAGGCAAALHAREEWLAAPPGARTKAAAPLSITVSSAQTDLCPPAPRPYSGVRVLDLTRVIAGPVATGFLAAYGANVLRVDPPGFAEVDALLPVTTEGKRTTALDLRSPAGRKAFEH